MNQPTAVRPRFRIEPLEDRLVPGSLIWQGVWLEAVVTAGTAWVTEHSADADVSIKHIKPAPVAEAAAAPVLGADLAAERPSCLPNWAEELLDQVPSQALESDVVPVPHAIARDRGRTASVADMLADVDQQLGVSEAAPGNANSLSDQKLPAWAADLLLNVADDLGADKRSTPAKSSAGSFR